MRKCVYVREWVWMCVLCLSIKPPPEKEIPKEEKDKYQEEFENFQQELDKRKEEFQKEHPDVQGQPSELLSFCLKFWPQTHIQL